MERELSHPGAIWTRALRSSRAAAALAGLAAVLTFANSLDNGFAYDDQPIIVENEAIHDIANLSESLTEPYWIGERGRASGIWRPVTTALLTVEWALWGENPRPYHAVNTALHGAVSAMATLVMAQMVPVAAALVGGLFFAVHPVHVEAVSNVVGVSELLAALLVLAACLVHLRWRKREEVSWAARVGSIGAISLLYGLAFLTKEHAAVLPALLFLIDGWMDRIQVSELIAYLRRRFALFASMAAVAFAVLWARFQVLGGIGDPEAPLGAEILQEIPRIWTLPLVWLHYVRLLVFPVDLSPDYSPSVIEIQLSWNPANAIGVVVVLAILGLAWATWRRRGPSSVVALAVLWFVILILPVANVFFLTEILLAERTLYLPSLGFTMALGVLAWRWAETSRAVLPVVGVTVVLAAMAARSWTATPVWESTNTVMNRILDRHPESGRAQWMLADVVMDDTPGSPAGLRFYSLAVSTTRSSYPVVASLIDHLIAMDALTPAANLSRDLWRSRPDRGRAPSRLAVVNSQLGRHSEVVEPALVALAVEPGNAVLLHLLAVAHREQGHWEEALRYRRAAIEEGEGSRWEQWWWLADLQRRVGDSAGALASLDSARARTNDEGLRARLDSLRGVWEAEP